MEMMGKRSIGLGCLTDDPPRLHTSHGSQAEMVGATEGLLGLAWRPHGQDDVHALRLQWTRHNPVPWQKV